MDLNLEYDVFMTCSQCKVVSALTAKGDVITMLFPVYSSHAMETAFKFLSNVEP